MKEPAIVYLISESVKNGQAFFLFRSKREQLKQPIRLKPRQHLSRLDDVTHPVIFKKKQNDDDVYVTFESKNSAIFLLVNSFNIFGIGVALSINVTSHCRF